MRLYWWTALWEKFTLPSDFTPFQWNQHNNMIIFKEIMKRKNWLQHLVYVIVLILLLQSEIKRWQTLPECPNILILYSSSTLATTPAVQHILAICKACNKIGKLTERKRCIISFHTVLVRVTPSVLFLVCSEHLFIHQHHLEEMHATGNAITAWSPTVKFFCYEIVCTVRTKMET